MASQQAFQASGGIDGTNGAGPVTLILVNIACKFSQSDVKDALDMYGLRGKFSVVYVPRVEVRKCNLGYAFVCFRTPQYAAECYNLVHGRVFGKTNTHKLCSVEVADTQGGIDALLNRKRRKQNGKVPEVLLCNDPVPEVRHCDDVPKQTARRDTTVHTLWHAGAPPPTFAAAPCYLSTEDLFANVDDDDYDSASSSTIMPATRTGSDNNVSPYPSFPSLPTLPTLPTGVFDVQPRQHLDEPRVLWRMSF